MTLTPDENARSPWLTIWLSPRPTIERLVADRPAYFVVPLVVLGTIASLCNQVAVRGGAESLGDWRFVTGLVLVAAVFGVASLYFNAFILSWIGKRLGGSVSAEHMRTIYAWSTPPVILCGLVVLALGFSVKSSEMLLAVLAILILVFSIWSFVIFFLMFARLAHFGFWRTISAYLLNVVVALALAVFVRTFLYQPFNIPSGAMRPTLLVGDYIFVSKFAYGYTHFSLPFSPPLFAGRILASGPERGDVVVFRLPSDPATDYVKRIVGLPGDRVQMMDGQLHINGTPVKRERLADIVAGDACGTASGFTVKRWRETLPNGPSYETLDCIENGFLDNTSSVTVPAGQYFMLGDNRDNSTDSRMAKFGTIPFENLIGRAGIVFFSKDAGEGNTGPHIREERIGTIVR